MQCDDGAAPADARRAPPTRGSFAVVASAKLHARMFVPELIAHPDPAVRWAPRGWFEAV